MTNTNTLLQMPKKDKYDKTTKYAIGEIEGREIYITEFLMAKELGYIDRFQGHRELISYLKLIPFLFVNSCFHDMYKNIHDNRVIFAINENERKIFHVVDENDFLVSVFVVSKQNFEKRLGRRFIHIRNLDGGTATPHILSPARPFWRHLGSVDALYQDLEKKTITQNDFIPLVDAVLDAKDKIAKYKKHFESLSAVDKIEIQEEIEKLKRLVETNIAAIDNLVYAIYGLKRDEIAIIEEKTV